MGGLVLLKLNQKTVHCNTNYEPLISVLFFYGGWGMSLVPPLCGGVLWVEGILELYDHPVPLLQLPLVLHVVLDQLCQGSELLPTVQVVVLPIVLDLYVGHFRLPPVKSVETILIEIHIRWSFFLYTRHKNNIFF